MVGWLHISGDETVYCGDADVVMGALCLVLDRKQKRKEAAGDKTHSFKRTHQGPTSSNQIPPPTFQYTPTNPSYHTFLNELIH